MKGIRFIAIGFAMAMCMNMGHAQSTHASANISVEETLDVSKYKTQDEFDGAVQTYFKSGGKADELLKALNDNWKPYLEVKNIYAKSDTKFSRYWESIFFNEHAFEKIIDVGNGNKNVWRILIVENSYFFKRYQTQLIFEDEDFAARGILFQFKYFDDVSEQSDERVERALESLVKNNRTSEEVVKIITAAGAKYSGNYKNGKNEITIDSYKYIPDYRVLDRYVTPWYIGMEYLDNRNQRYAQFKIQAQEPKLNIVMP